MKNFMKKLVKELLVVIVAICATVGLFAFAGMPQWFNNFFVVPNAGLNGLLNNGGLNPAGGNPLAPVPPAGGNVPGGAGLVPPAGGAGGNVGGGANAIPIGAFLNQNVIIKNGMVDPLIANIPTTATVTWKNGTPESRMIVDPNNVFSSGPVAIAPGAVFTSPAFAVAGTFNYKVVNPANALDVFNGSVKVFVLPLGVAPQAPGGAGVVPPAGGAGGGVVGVAPGGAVAGAPQMAVTVWIAKNSILPNQTNIPVGASVTWKNVSPFPRKLESVVPGLLSSPVIPSGGSWTNTFTAVGPIKYRAMGVGNPAQIPINASLTVN